MNLFKDASHYFRNRYIDKLHCLQSPQLKKGEYYELDERILFCLFDEFKKFIEEEMTLETLDWCTTLDDEHPEQADFGRKAKILYHWWTQERPNRGDAGDVVGYYKAFDEFEKEHGPWSSVDRETGIMTFQDSPILEKLGKEVNELEAKWKDEDTQMLRTLIDIRGWLWT